jgi:hypothetical protein
MRTTTGHVDVVRVPAVRTGADLQPDARLPQRMLGARCETQRVQHARRS